LAIARLSRVAFLSSRSEVGALLAELLAFGQFHPSRREGLVQDIDLLLLGSRAQSVSSEARELLGGRPPGEGENNIEHSEFKAQDVPGLIGVLERSLAEVRERLPGAVEAEKGELYGRLGAIREAAADLFKHLYRIRVYPGLKRFVILEGYVPTTSLGTLERRAGRFLLSVEQVEKRRPRDPYVPSLLVNPRVISLFESFTLEQGVPRYNEIDPTPIVAFVFPFFFGIMFSDVGHGIVLFAFGLFLEHRTRHTYWGQLISIFGVSAMLIGFVRGTFFGIRFANPLHSLIPLPQALTQGFTLAYVPLLLETAIVIGTFHLATAYAIAFLNQVRYGNYGEAFLSHLPTLLLYASMVPLGLAVAGNGIRLSDLFASDAPTPVFSQFLGLEVPVSVTASVSLPVILASILLLVVGLPLREYRSTRSVRKAVGAFGSGLLVTVAKSFEFLMNTISYVRLGILLIVGAVLGGLVANVLSFGVAGVVLAVILNICVIGIEGLIVYVQDMRLHVYEWCSKFYFGEGIPFAPLVPSGRFYRFNFA
jgi:V/A-type H+/Na+-transporting ATPase subunit I